MEYSECLNQLAKLKADEQNNANIALEKLHKCWISTSLKQHIYRPNKLKISRHKLNQKNQADKLKKKLKII